MAEPKYRSSVQFDSEKQLFVARTPELEHCQAEGATRAEAMAKLEEEMEAQIRNMREQGGQPPRAVDEEDFSGELAVKVSRTLHRELAYQARGEGIELAQLTSELLAGALEARRAGRGERRRPGPNEADGERGPRNHDRLRQGFGNAYHGIMDDRANFIEYVRGLEQGNQAPGGPPGMGGGGRRRHRHGKGPGG
jgi:predicted RNase H-like HicB family nuclease